VRNPGEFGADTRGQPVGIAAGVLVLIGFALVFILMQPIADAMYETFSAQTSTTAAQTGLDRTHTMFSALPFFVTAITFALGLVVYAVFQRGAI
jgi:Sec-independent protein secretion pathway component TatC